LNDYNIDFNRLLIKPLYLGLVMNIFIPAVILLAAYYIDNSGGFAPMLDAGMLKIAFWVLIVIAIADGGIAIMLKQKLFMAPMIKSKDSFESDLAAKIFRASLICYVITTVIAFYGIICYILGSDFNHLLLFVFISFIAFQLIRPRIKFIEKVVATQKKYVEQGIFSEA
jgi:hypothetical protein